MRSKNFIFAVLTLALGWSSMWSITKAPVIFAELTGNQANMTGNISSIISSFSFSGGKLTYSNPTSTSTDNDTEPIKIIIGGDMMFDRNVRALGMRYGYDSLLANIKPTLSDADIAVANLEGPITDNASHTLLSDGKMTDSFTFTFDPISAHAIAKAGFTAVSLANNHTDNFGVSGVTETEKYLGDAGVQSFGTPWNASSTEYVKCIRNVCIAFVGYHAFHSGIQNILQDIRRLKANNDYVIVMPHWGEEYNIHPTTKIQDQARQLVLAGADAVIGSHPHVIEDHEWIGTTPVYYSLGNLLFDQYFSPETMNGMLVELFISKKDSKPVLDHIRTIQISNANRRSVTILDN